MKLPATIVSAVMGATAASALGSSSLSLRARQARANGVKGVTPNAPATNAPAGHANGAPAVASSNTPTVRALHHSLGIQKVSGADANIMASNQDVVGTGGTGTPSFTKNYAGVVKAGAGQTIVSGTVVMPQPKVPAGADPAQEYVASTWVGMDGIDDDCSAILQTGIDMHITPGGNVSYEAWFEWYPEPALKATDFPVAPGDSITLSVTSTPADKKSGTAKLINHTNNKQVEHAFTGQTTALCQSNAEVSSCPATT